MHKPEFNLLKDVVCLLERLLESQEKQTKLLDHNTHLSEKILHLLEHPPLTGFTIRRTDMALTPLDPGAVATFTATPTPAGAVLPAGNVPSWTSSDPTVTLAVDPTGLIATVTIATTATVGASITLTITAAALADGTIPTGSLTFQVGAVPPAEVSGFTITQTA